MTDRRGSVSDRREHASPGGATTGTPFTMDAYRTFLRQLLDADYRFARYGDRPHGPGTVLLRHDVDISPERALAMARAEADLGVTATYFFLVTAPVYDLLHPATREAIEEIAGCGHAVGVHFDVHHYWEGRPADGALVDAVHRERESLDRVVDVTDAVSFHVPPEWLLGRRFDQFTSVYDPAFFEEMTYRSDSNQRWRREDPFPDGLPERTQVLVHPGLWHDQDRELDEILATLARRSRGEVDEYMALLGE